MRVTTIAWLGLLVAPLLLTMQPASAQVRPPEDSNVHYGGMLKPKVAPAPAAPSVPAPPSAWPRLDPGSVVCRTEEDLRRHAAQMVGEWQGPADCQPITQPTAIKILMREGPGATEVRLTATNATGWTDAWLPSSPPPGITATSAQQ